MHRPIPEPQQSEAGHWLDARQATQLPEMHTRPSTGTQVSVAALPVHTQAPPLHDGVSLAHCAQPAGDAAVPQ